MENSCCLNVGAEFSWFRNVYLSGTQAELRNYRAVVTRATAGTLRRLSSPIYSGSETVRKKNAGAVELNVELFLAAAIFVRHINFSRLIGQANAKSIRKPILRKCR